MADRFGLGWRDDLAAGILSNLHRIDVLEVIADDYFHASAKKLRALRDLAAQHPVLLHAVSLGMASTIAVDEKRLAVMARLCDAVRPQAWSEHLAFVRAGGIEIGHMASPPRNAASIDATLANIHRAAHAVGAAPAMENVASLIDPPGSTIAEAAWLASIASHSPGGLLLDLHNVYSNAVNFGYDARSLLETIPLQHVRFIHLAGGKWIGNRILDDHLHDVPGPVYELLRFVAEHAPQPLTVILERDGAYPPIGALLAQLDRARLAVAEGRKAAYEHARV
ncbi:MAG: DUF692 domain-containing protein [Bryobacterales bacterium]|nr:DUF692 domain-containing protein [Bryobacterales bacterium]